MSLGEDGLRAVFAEETEEVFISLLEFDDAQTGTLIYATDSSVNVSYASNLYVAFPFELTLPPDDGESIPTTKIRLSNVSLDLMNLLRGMIDPPRVRVTIVMASDLTSVKADVNNLKLSGFSATTQTIDLSAAQPDYLIAAFPAHTYSRGNYRTLF